MMKKITKDKTVAKEYYVYGIYYYNNNNCGEFSLFYKADSLTKKTIEDIQEYLIDDIKIDSPCDKVIIKFIKELDE